MPLAGPRRLLRRGRDPDLRVCAPGTAGAGGRGEQGPQGALCTTLHARRRGRLLEAEPAAGRRSPGPSGSRDTILRHKTPSQGRSPAPRRAASCGSGLMGEKRILCVGLVVLDIINVVDKYPEEDTDTR